MSDLQPLGRVLIVMGTILMGCGLVVLLAPKIPWVGRLPGDVIIQRERFTVYFPLASGLLASLLLSLVLWLLTRFRP